MDNVNRLRVGLFAPDFVLKDSEGGKIRLSDFRGKKSLLLFFCPGRRNQVCLDWLERLNRLYHQIQLKDAEVLSLSLDETWISRRIKRKKNIQFPILKIERDSELNSAAPTVIQQYGLQTGDSEEKDVHPAIFLVDRYGTVRYRKVYTQPSDEFNGEELLCELDKLV